MQVGRIFLFAIVRIIGNYIITKEGLCLGTLKPKKKRKKKEDENTMALLVLELKFTYKYCLP